MQTTEFFAVLIDGEHLHSADSAPDAIAWADGREGAVEILHVTQTWSVTGLDATDITATATPLDVE